MPHTWALVDSSFPTFTDDEKYSDKIEKLVDYMKILVEALQYQLENLDTANWNTAALKTFQTDTTEDVTEQVGTLASNLTILVNEVTQISARVSSLESLSGRVNQNETDISYLEKDVAAVKEDLEEIREELSGVQADVDELKGVVSADGDGNASVGAEGKAVYLVGNVYINGKLVE